MRCRNPISLIPALLVQSSRSPPCKGSCQQCLKVGNSSLLSLKVLYPIAEC